MAVPEADRDVNKDPIYYQKKNAIFAIPLVDEEGNEVENESRARRNYFQSGVYELEDGVEMTE